MRSDIARRVRNALPGGVTQRMGRVGHVMELAIPSAGEQLLSMMVGLVNTYLVGHLGASSLAAVGIANQWVMMAMILFSAVGTGATALIARMIGAGDHDTANRVLRQSLFIAFGMGIISTVLLLAFAEPAMRLMGAEEEALQLGARYLQIVSGSYLLASIMFVGNASLRGAGDTRTPMLVMAVVNVLNMVIAWSLINGAFGLPRIGVAGSATGELIGRLTGGILVVYILVRGRAGLRLQLTRWRPDGALLRRILQVGLPTGIEQTVFRFGMMSFARVVAALGTASYAAHQVALNAESLSYMPGFGFAVATTTLVGQGLGARNPKQAASDGFTAFYLGAFLMTLMGVVFIIFAEPLVGIFTTDPEVIALGTPPLRMIGLVQPFLASTMILAGGLRGAGETRSPMFINGMSIWIVRVPIALLLTQVFGFGLTGAWIAMSLDLTVRGSLMFVLFRRGKWQTVEV